MWLGAGFAQPPSSAHGPGYGLGQGYAGRVAFERRTLHLPDLSAEEPNIPRASVLAGEDFQAYSGVPLIAKGKVEGVLEIFHRAPLHAGQLQ